jgi:hypothetical protein
MFRQAPDCISAEVEGALVILTPQMTFVQLDEIGSGIWTAIKHHHELDALGDALLERFDIDRVTLDRDLVSYLPKLQSAGLITIE